jgi:hypothetical protein
VSLYHVRHVEYTYARALFHHHFPTQQLCLVSQGFFSFILLQLLVFITFLRLISPCSRNMKQIYCYHVYILFEFDLS